MWMAAPALLAPVAAQDFIPPSELSSAGGDGGDLASTLKDAQLRAPTMDEEEKLSKNMPERYRCDACKAVMFQLDKALRAKHFGSRRLKQWEYTDLFDEACHKGGFKGYGVKMVNGINELSGPGIEKEDPLTKHIGTMQFNSESWSERLAGLCRSFVYEKIGEDETYDMFYSDFVAEKGSSQGGITEALCFSELRQCGSGSDGESSKPAKASAKQGKKKKKNATKAATKKSGSGALSFDEFLVRLAEKHNLAEKEYAAPRAESEWEDAVLAMAGNIFKQQRITAEL